METEIAQVTTATVALLAPFMPILLETAKFSAAAIGEMIVQNGGEAAWQRAKTLWSKIRGQYKEDGVINGAASMVAAQPENEHFQTLLAVELAKRLQENDSLLQELQSLLGGQEAVQKVLAEHDSWVEDVKQKISGSGGTQITKATDGGTIIGVKQSIER